MVKVMKYAHRLFFRWLFGTLYVSGLTLLYLYLILFSFSAGSFILLAIACALLLAGVIGTHWRQKTKSRTLRALGLTTLIPGTVGVLLLAFGRATLNALLPQGITPFVETYLAFALPKTAALAVVYFVLGAVLLYRSRKLR
jgi:hypothetical protein